MLEAIAYLLALGQLARVYAAPTDLVRNITSIIDYDDIKARAPKAPKYPLAVDLQSVSAQHTTWHGVRTDIGPFGFTAAQVKQAAEDTYSKYNEGRSINSMLVSVIYIPRAGLVAGTVWHGDDTWWGNYARETAPKFWRAVPGDQQQLIPNARNRNKWHAEAVAARLAEETFGPSFMTGDRWPLGTQVYTFGKVDGNLAAEKVSCVTSNVIIPCSQWLPRLGITML
jgi:hypothetical protein